MSLSQQNKVEFPDFNEIMEECKKKMIEKFPEYGNTWKHEPLTLHWWLQRLRGEISEIKKTKNPTKITAEIIDAINILAMIYERIGSRCYKCNKRITQFQVLNGQPTCMDCFIDKSQRNSRRVI